MNSTNSQKSTTTEESASPTVAPKAQVQPILVACPRCSSLVEPYGATKVKKHKATTECKVCAKTITYSCERKTPNTCSKVCAAATIDYEARAGKTLATLKESYGEDIANVSQLSTVKEAKRITLEERYGVSNPSKLQEFQEKKKATSLSKYGVENPAQAREIKDKAAATNLQRYGVVNVFQSAEVQAKIKSTNLERYGVENIFQTEKSRLAMIQAKSRRVSKVNRSWSELLERNIPDLELQLEAPFSKQSSFHADLQANDLLIDFNPSFTHSSSHSYVHLTQRCKETDCKDPKHAPYPERLHQLRFLEAEAAGKVLLQYFDWYDAEIFESIIRSKLHRDEQRVGAKRCEVREISQRDANRFFKENHLLGAARNQTFCVGLFYKEELVHVHSYGPARLNKSYEWEAIRSCSKMNWQVQGGFSRADSFFFKSKDPDSVISYVDLALGGGETEANNPGWELLSINKPAATWVLLGSDSKRGSKPRFVKEAAARKLSADRLLGLAVGEKYPELHKDGSKFTNEDVLIAEGYVRVHDVGTRTFGWRRGS